MGHSFNKMSVFVYYTVYSFCRDVLVMCLFSVAVYYNMHSLEICVVYFKHNV
jgi:hypothetical protein